MSLIPAWREVSAQPGACRSVAPDQRLPPGRQTAALGAQHVIAMFGATVLAPILMGFDANVAILMSGVGTLISPPRCRPGAELPGPQASPSSAS